MLKATLLFAALSLLARNLPAQEGHGVTPADIERGGQVFLTNCANCHGPDGDAVAGVNLASNRFRRAPTDRDLIGIIQNGIPGTPMPPGNYTDQIAAAIAAYLHSMARSAPSLLSGAHPGDPARGRAIVEGKGQCLNCHRIDGVGSFLGPDLSEAGATRRLADLERSLVDPGAEIRTDNRTVRAVRKDGSTIPAARLMNQDTYTLQIIDRTGKLLTLRKADLREFEIMKASPMPEYKDKLTTQELADTIGYLVTRKGGLR